MAPPRPPRHILVLLIALIANLLLIVAWATRPAFLFFDRVGFGLGFVGDRHYPPVRVIRDWLEGSTAPWTPAGFCSIFFSVEPEDLLIVAALLIGLALLIVTAVRTVRSSRRRCADAAVPRRQPGFGQFRVRTALATVALVGLYLGWELEAWRSWNVRLHYLRKASVFGQQEGMAVDQLKSSEASRAIAESDFPGWTRARTEDARAADRAAGRDQYRGQAARAAVMATTYAQLKHKYLRAAAHPRHPVEPDPPLPTPPENWPFAYEVKPDQALSAYAEQLRRYPALVSAHERQAWLLATCSDARVRDGKAAVATETRACELSEWKSSSALLTLAAAYAEVGDFPRAVQWQRRAMDRYPAIHPDGKGKQDATTQFNQAARKWMQDCLELYNSSKPFRGTRSVHWGD